MEIKYRLLEKEDYHKGFLNVVNFFTKSVSNVSYEEFLNHFDKVINENTFLYVAVYDNKIIGAAKLLVEYKFHNNLTKMGHIEDVVIDQNYRGNGIGKKLMELIINKGKSLGCYKVTLCSSEKNKHFYIKCGLKLKDLEMSTYFN